MPLIETKGAASAQGFGLTLQQTAVNYIEDVFSTWLYTGTGVSQTITNGIDLSTKGGLVWTKARSSAFSNGLVDTARGTTNTLISNATDASDVYNTVTAFNTNGFTVGTSAIANGTGTTTMVSWTFRKQPKFFDVVTWTGDGSNKTISHNLGSAPGCIIAKRTDAAGSWYVYHRSLSTPNESWLLLQTTGAANTTGGTNVWNVTSTTFQADTYFGLSTNGATYVAYLFAHDAGGFGLSGTDNVITCGSFTTDGSGVIPAVTLGYEPQWLLIKETSGANSWFVFDNMRQMSMTNAAYLNPNSSGAEALFGYGVIAPTATGFVGQSGSPAWNPSATFIYIAIRRGPMKVPTSGTSVFSPNIWTGTGSTQQITTGFFPDMFIGINRGAVHAKTYATDILRGLAVSLATNVTDAENSESGNTFNMTGYSNNNGNLNSAFGGGQTYVGHFFRRAPGFFDIVCYTGTATASNNTLTHNLGVIPELIIIKQRSGTAAWAVAHTFSATDISIQSLNDTTAEFRDTYANVGWLTQKPTATQFILDDISSRVNSAGTYVAYLFATLAGVSKVGSYTGNGSNQTINCGFTGGSRFVLIKRTDSTGDWYVWDSARGIVSGNDPHLSLNTTAAEVTTDDSVDTDSTGFIVNQLAATNINVSSASYIFLAVA